MKDTLQTRKEIKMYIKKQVVASWDTDEEETINSFREFIQEKMEVLEGRGVRKDMIELYRCLDQLDTMLAGLIDNDYLMTVDANDWKNE